MPGVAEGNQIEPKQRNAATVDAVLLQGSLGNSPTDKAPELQILRQARWQPTRVQGQLIFNSGEFFPDRLNVCFYLCVVSSIRGGPSASPFPAVQRHQPQSSPAIFSLPKLLALLPCLQQPAPLSCDSHLQSPFVSECPFWLSFSHSPFATLSANSFCSALFRRQAEMLLTVTSWVMSQGRTN